MDLRKPILIQEKLREKIKLEDGFREAGLVGGADTHFRGDRAHTSLVVLDLGSLDPLEETSSVSKVSFPYVPTFLTFREAPSIIRIFKGLKHKPDVLLIDGQGIAHPRGIGLASHVGVLLDTPTIGVAKKRLIGSYEEPKEVGEASELLYDDRQIGWVFKSKKGTRPLFISPGHRVSIESSLDIVKGSLKDHKLPEPLHLAHQRAKQMSQRA